MLKIIVIISLPIIFMASSMVDSPEFTSSYSDFRSENCRLLDDEYSGGDVPSVCEGIEGYHTYIYYDMYGNGYITVNSDDVEEGWTQNLSVSECTDAQLHGDRLEWRFADGVPFACILRQTCVVMRDSSDKDSDIVLDYWEILDEYMMVVGLKGYDKIYFEIDVQTVANANKEARKMADETYLTYYN